MANEARHPDVFPIQLNEEMMVTLAVAEFNDRRSEINNRTTIQHVLISLNITAAGAIGGVAITAESPNRPLLLLLAPICSAFALAWANHADTIFRIGAFIRRRIRPIIERESGELWRWELDHDVFKDNSWQRVRGLGPPLFLMFIGPPAFALAFSFESLLIDGSAAMRSWYAVAAAITAYTAVNLYWTLRGPRFTADLEAPWP